MSRLILLVSTLLAFGLSACTSSSSPTLEDPVEVEGGLVAGVRLPDSPVRAYKGIPFAAPPVGELRWKPPQPVAPWEGVLQADAFSDACVQPLQRSRLPWSEAFMHQGDASEDCLYLNVWTAAERPGEQRPVMVYIHGGGLREGSSAIATYDGEAFARKGVVLVGINYRLGPIGFLAHPELTQESEHNASGNYGFLDQIAALEWVRDHIAAFGGDPNNVTVFGQSAGARSVAVLMQSPLARGLFARGIRHSGSERREPFASNGPTLAEAEQTGLAAQDSLGVGSLAELRQIPAERFFELDLGRMGAVVDGRVLPAGPSDAGEVPVMIGCTANDGFSGPDDAELTLEAFREQAQELYGDHADAFLALYPPDAGADPAALKLEAMRDRARVSIDLWAERQQAKSDPIYAYYFARAIPWPEHPEFGAFHTGEIPYVFNTLGALDRPWEPVDRTVADQVSSYWVNFAATGNPNGEGLPEWPAFDAPADVTMRLGAEMGPIPTADPDKAAFWEMMLTESPDRQP